MLRIGTLDRRLTLQSLSTAPDSVGQPVETWTTVATLWGRIMPMPSGERFAAQQITGKAMTTFRIRYRDGVTVKYRMLFDGKTWDINDVRLVGRKEALDLDASARSDG